MEKPEDDPVVEEITVYLSKDLQKLYLAQYPLRQNGSGYEESTISNTKIKPVNRELHMEIELDTRSTAPFDPLKARNIAANARRHEKKGSEQEKFFDGDMMDKIILKSTKALPDCKNYGIGVLKNGKLYISSLNGIIQMRPAFDYLDKHGKKGKNDEGEDEEEEEEEKEEKPQQVNVTIARNVPDGVKKKSDKSFHHYSKKSAEEKWMDVEYFPSYSSKAELTRLELTHVDKQENTLNMSEKQYFDALAPSMVEESYSSALKNNLSNAPRHASSFNNIRTLPLLDQVKIIMKEVQVTSFDYLRSLLPPDHETSSILRYLQQVAVLVKGNWIISSEIIYQKETFSAYSGVPAELMCKARDYVLLYFTEHEYIDRKAISSVMKLPADEIREILVNLAKHQPKKGWKLKSAENEDFPKRYPEIAQRQKDLWEAKKKNFGQMMNNQNRPQRQRRRSNRESISSENEEKITAKDRKSLRDSSFSDNDSSTETAKHKKSNRGRKISEAL